MKVQATYEDANLILRLYDLRREERLRAARKAFVVNGILNRKLSTTTRCATGRWNKWRRDSSNT